MQGESARLIISTTIVSKRLLVVANGGGQRTASCVVLRPHAARKTTGRIIVYGRWRIEESGIHVIRHQSSPRPALSLRHASPSLSPVPVSIERSPVPAFPRGPP